MARVATLVVVLVLGGPLFARMRGHEMEDVPVDRLLTNCQAWVEKHPDDPHGQYVLGRLHAIAFVKGETAQQSVQKDEGPGDHPPEVYPPHFGDLQGKDVASFEEARRKHLTEAIACYRRATELGGGVAEYWLGLGGLLDDGAQFAEAVGGKAAEWKEEALGAYRKAYAAGVEADLKLESIGPLERTMSVEAARGIVRLLGELRGGAPSDAEKEEIAKVEKTSKEIEGKEHWITPVVFPLDDEVEALGGLLGAPPVRFDLDGLGNAGLWPWVGPRTGILVWDPKVKGEITSGRQLFGSITWWVLWRDGYEPLMLLDDDGDGWLSGGELTGISVWSDADGDGVSDPGEVVPVAAAGIERLAAHATGLRDGVPSHDSGIRLLDGRIRPTWDWTPFSLPSE